METREIQKKAREYIELETDPDFKKEVEDLLKDKNWEELSDRFYTELEFGTGGIRGKIGGGFNRINSYVIRRATEGLANYILAAGFAHPSVVIAYDSRRYSPEFAAEAALVLARKEITAYVFSSLRPTPELSYAVRELGASAGIVITASHNPPAYNGYKVYWSDGGQIVPPHDKGIIAEVLKVKGAVLKADSAEAEASGRLRYIDTEIDEKYYQVIKNHSIHPEVFEKFGNSCKVVFTPLHGTGAKPVMKILGDMGLKVIPVPEQLEPDGNFPTVDYPNPEEASAMQMALELARKEGADLVMGTDPDADRLGIAVPDEKEYRLITGNQLGVLLADYIFSQLKEAGKLPPKPALVKTVVTTELQTLIAESYGAETFNVLTGFKYIAEKIREFENTRFQYIFGGEESYGYLIGTEVRDKDAVSAAAMTAEMALYHFSKGKTVLKRLRELYITYGYFKEILISKTLEGREGKEKIVSIMKTLREDIPEKFGGPRIITVRDYQRGKEFSTGEAKEADIGLPKSNVLQFITEDNSIISVRPSGTEPKIKFYASARAKPGMDPEKAEPEVDAKLKAIERDIEDLMS